MKIEIDSDSLSGLTDKQAADFVLKEIRRRREEEAAASLARALNNPENSTRDPLHRVLTYAGERAAQERAAKQREQAKETEKADASHVQEEIRERQGIQALKGVLFKMGLADTWL